MVEDVFVVVREPAHVALSGIAIRVPRAVRGREVVDDTQCGPLWGDVRRVCVVWARMTRLALMAGLVEVRSRALECVTVMDDSARVIVLVLPLACRVRGSESRMRDRMGLDLGVSFAISPSKLMLSIFVMEWRCSGVGYVGSWTSRLENTSAYAFSRWSSIVVVPVGRHEVCEVLYSRSGRKNDVVL